MSANTYQILHDIFIAALGAVIGGIIGHMSAKKFSRKPEDAVTEDILVKTNDEIRKMFEVADRDNYEPYSIRINVGSPNIDYLVENIHHIGHATVRASYIGVITGSHQLMTRGDSLFRFSAISTISNNDKNIHRDKTKNSAKAESAK